MFKSAIPWNPTLDVSQESTPQGSGMDGPFLDAVTMNGVDMATALMSTGMSPCDALIHVREVCGTKVAGQAWGRLMEGPAMPGNHLMPFLDSVAQTAPWIAQEWLSDALAKGKMEAWDVSGRDTSGQSCLVKMINLSDRAWVTSLPEGLHVAGGLSLTFCPNLASLPKGLRVDGDMWLNDATSLKTLPEGIHVGGFLSLNGCDHFETLPRTGFVGRNLHMERCRFWDNNLPDGFHVGRTVRGGVSIKTIMGVTPQEWRGIYGGKA